MRGVGGMVVAMAVAIGLAGCASPPGAGAGASAGASATAGAGAGAGGSASMATAGPPPGQWQLTIEIVDMPGATGKAPPPQTLAMCSTPEDKRQWQDMVSGKAMAGCAFSNFNASGSTISYALKCGEGIEGKATITVVDDDNYRGESTLSFKGAGAPSVIRSRMTGKRTAKTCSKS